MLDACSFRGHLRKGGLAFRRLYKTFDLASLGSVTCNQISSVRNFDGQTLSAKLDLTSASRESYLLKLVPDCLMNLEGLDLHVGSNHGLDKLNMNLRIRGHAFLHRP